MTSRLRLQPQHLVFAAFYLYALGLGGVFPRLGDLQMEMEIGKDVLGRALIGAALGTQVALMFAGPVIERIGYRLTLMIGLPALALFMALAAMTTGPWGLFAALFFAGLQIGAVEILINLEADRVEHQIGRRIMNRAHAFWSFGFFSAGLIGAAAKQAEVPAGVHLGIMAVMITLISVVLMRHYCPAPARLTESSSPQRFVRPTGPILVLVAFTLSAMLLEGGAADWSAIYMRDVFASAPFTQGFAFAIGAFAQAVTRFFADGLVERIGPVRVARALVAVLAAGVLAVTFAPHAFVALIGFALMGIGTSAMFPLAMSAAAQRTDRPARINVAALAQLSFITFLIAPPLLGEIGEAFGLRASFGIGIPLVVLSWFTLSSLAPKPGEPS